MARGQPGGEESYTPEVSPEDLPRKLTPEMRPDNVGPALQQLGNTLTQKYQADSATWAGDQVSQFRLKAVQDMEDMKAKVPAGDPGNFTEQYLQNFDKQAEQLVGTAGRNPYAANMVTKGLTELRDTLATHAMGWEATQRVAYQNDSLQGNLDQQLPLVRAHPELAPQVGSTLMDQLNASRNDPATKLKYGRTMDAQLTRSAALGLADQNPSDVYSQLLSDQPTSPILQHLTDPQARSEVLEAAQAGVVKSAAQGALAAYRTGGPAAGQAAYAGVDKLQLPGTPEQQEDMREKIRTGIRGAQAEMISQNQQAQAPKIMAVEEAIKSGTPGPATRSQVWDLYHANALQPEVAGSYLGQIDAANRKNALDGAGMQLIQDAWDGKNLLDPKDSTQKTDANNWFIDRTDQLKLPQGSQGWINMAAEFSRRTGMVPEPVSAWSRSVLVGSQDPKQVLSAVDAIDRVRAASPRGFQYLDDDGKTGAMADSIDRLTKSGVDPTQAIAMARTNAAAGDNDRKRLDELWKSARVFGAGDNAIESVLHSQIASDPRLSEYHWYKSNSVPNIPPGMQADYYAATRAYFNYNGGNAGAAQSAAARDIGNTWGLTAMNGEPEIVRYPPERMFRAPNGGPGLTAEDIRTDVAQTVVKNPDAFQHFDAATGKLAGFHVEPDSVHLVESPATALTNGRTWGLAYKGEDGVTEALYGKDGKPLQFDLPVSAQDYKQLRAQATKDAVAKAQKAYDAQTATEAASRRLLQFQQDEMDQR